MGSSNRHRKKRASVKMTRTPFSLPPPPPIDSSVGGTGKSKKKRGGVSLWMRFDRTGAMEVAGCDKCTIIKRASVSAKDLRTAFSHSSKILGTRFELVSFFALTTFENKTITNPSFALQPERKLLSLI